MQGSLETTLFIPSEIGVQKDKISQMHAGMNDSRLSVQSSIELLPSARVEKSDIYHLQSANNRKCVMSNSVISQSFSNPLASTMEKEENQKDFQEVGEFPNSPEKSKAEKKSEQLGQDDDASGNSFNQLEALTNRSVSMIEEAKAQSQADVSSTFERYNAILRDSFINQGELTLNSMRSFKSIEVDVQMP